MTKKQKAPIRRDDDFEQLDEELEAALRALETANERTLTVLQQVEKGPEPVEAVRGGEGAAVDEAGPESGPAG